VTAVTHACRIRAIATGYEAACSCGRWRIVRIGEGPVLSDALARELRAAHRRHVAREDRPSQESTRIEEKGGAVR
jgi:hypothetical protein